jgi:hypothetical protein
MARPRKTEHDDLYNEDSLNHDLTPEQIREQTALQDESQGANVAEREGDRDADLQSQRDGEAEEMLELGEREDGEYFDSLRDDESEDDQ